MTLQITKSFDNSGPGDQEFGKGSTSRDLLVAYNKLIQWLSYGNVQGNPTFAIDTNFDVKNTEIVTYTIAGVQKTLADNTNWNTGTAAVIAANKWSIAILTHSGSATAVTWAGATTQGYASEALAIAELRTNSRLQVPSTSAALGYITVLTGADVTWTAGTDALEGGTGGTAATTTNYYNDPTLNGAYGPRFIGNESGTVITQ
jgi:hypothetical protein